MEIVIGLLIGLLVGAVFFRYGRREVSALNTQATDLRSELDTVQNALQNLALSERTAQIQLEERDSALATMSRERDSAQERLRAVEHQLSEAREELAHLQSEHHARLDELHKKQVEIDTLFKSIAADVARASNEEFRKQAAEDFKRQRELADQELKQNVEPVGKSLDILRQQIADLEKQRVGAYHSVNELIELTQQQVGRLSSETGELREILRSSRHRGRWGEATLENLLELAGMRRGKDFRTQISGELGRSIADVVVRMPGGKQIIIDSKTPFDAYREALDAAGEADQRALLEKHANNILSEAEELRRRGYDAQFENAMDFIVMWIPTDSILEGATRVMPDLIEQAYAKHRILLATPVTMIALVSGVAAALHQEEQTELLHKNALKIQEAGALLYSGVRNHAAAYLKLGRQLTKAVQSYDEGVSSIQGNLIRGARDMRELGVGEGDDIADPQQLHLETRTYRSRELRDLNQPVDATD